MGTKEILASRYADQLQLTRPTRFDAKAFVSGRPAIVRNDQFDLEGPPIELDRGQN